jgi:hypothetical protein
MAGRGIIKVVVDEWVNLWCSISKLSEVPSLDHPHTARARHQLHTCDLEVSRQFSVTQVSMNISGTLNVFRLIRDPALCLPQHTVSTFNHLPIPLSKAFPKKDGLKEVDIRAVVLDKDNCFAVPHSNEVHKPYNVSDSSHLS